MSDPEKPKTDSDKDQANAEATGEDGAANGEDRTASASPWQRDGKTPSDGDADADAARNDETGDDETRGDETQSDETQGDEPQVDEPTAAADADESTATDSADDSLNGQEPPTGDPADGPADPPARSGLSLPARALIVLLLLLIGAGGGIAAFPWLAGQLGPWIPALQVSAPAADQSALDERLAALETAAGERDSRLGDLDAGLEALRRSTVTLTESDQRLETALADRTADGAGDAQALAALEDRVSALQQRLAGLARPAAATTSPSSEGGSATPPAQAMPGDNAALQRAEQDLARLNGALDGLRQALTARTDALAERLGAAETALGAAKARDQASAAVLALAQLRDSLTAGRPFAAELKTAEALSPEAEQLAPLRAHAADGLGPLDRLVQDFAPVAREIVRAAQQPDGEDWMARTTARLGSLVTVRRVGEVAGESIDARVARAEVRLTRGDLAGAVAQLEGLEGAPAEPAADWLARARERLSLSRLVDTVLAGAIAAAGQG